MQDLLHTIHHELRRQWDRGDVASYIPELAGVDPRKFGIAIRTVAGESFAVGDADEPLSIQSISKVFALTMALGKLGDGLWRRVGREPSGSAFNSIVQLEHDGGIPRNPFINAGAVVMADILLDGHPPDAAIAAILGFVRHAAGDATIAIDAAVAQSESATGHRNAALANYMKSFGNIANPVEEVLSVYFNQCALALSCRQLAEAGLYLANGGVNPATGATIVAPERARRINALMLTCGHYDASGDFAYRVGLPSKSGVGGGILAIVPGHASVAVWSPGLNKYGSSHVGLLALEELAKRSGWSVF
jgi:glutaminase